MKKAFLEMDDAEMGEDEMEEGESEWLDIDSDADNEGEQVGKVKDQDSEEGSEPPQLVPISEKKEEEKKQMTRAERIEASKQVRIIEDKMADRYSDIHSDIDTSELEMLEEDQEDRDPHGFVYMHNLDTYRKNKKEKLEEAEKEKQDPNYQKEGRKKRRDRKKGGSTNRVKQKNKPMSMMLPKKA